MEDNLVLSLGDESEPWVCLPAGKPFSVRIGRSAEADLSIPSRIPEELRNTVSRIHARLFHDGSFFWVEDLESQNFTSCNGKITFGACTLQPPCQITLGALPLRLELLQTTQAPPQAFSTFDVAEFAGASAEALGNHTTVLSTPAWGRVKNYLRLCAALQQTMEALSEARRAAEIAPALARHLGAFFNVSRVQVALPMSWEAFAARLEFREKAAEPVGIDLEHQTLARDCCTLPATDGLFAFVAGHAGRKAPELVFVEAAPDQHSPDLDLAAGELLTGLAGRFALSLFHSLAEAESQRAKTLESVPRVPSASMIEACRQEEIWGESASFTRSLYHADLAATRYLSVVHRNNRLGVVFILGETGTGKSALARAMHRLSNHKNEPFCELNCAAIPVPLAESELFGYEKGAHDKAFSNRAGWFEVAGNGMLFLDEIGKTSTDFQSKLLKVLDTGEYFRLGSSVTRRTNCHVILATSEDPGKLCESGRLLQEFWFRAGAFTITLAPLRERPEDIVVLAARKLGAINEARPQETPKHFSAKVLALFKAYPWPGNVRELLQCVEVAYSLSPPGCAEIGVEHLPETFLRGLGLPEELPAQLAGEMLERNWDAHIASAERAYLAGMIGACGGNLSEVARRAEKSYQTIHNKLRDLRAWLGEALDDEGMRERDALQALAGDAWTMICKAER